MQSSHWAGVTLPDKLWAISRMSTNHTTHMHGARPRHLCSHTVLLHQGLLGQVDLQGVIRAEADAEATSKKGGEWIPVVVQEQAVVAEGAHAQPHLHDKGTAGLLQTKHKHWHGQTAAQDRCPLNIAAISTKRIHRDLGLPAGWVLHNQTVVNGMLHCAVMGILQTNLHRSCVRLQLSLSDSPGPGRRDTVCRVTCAG